MIYDFYPIFLGILLFITYISFKFIISKDKSRFSEMMDHEAYRCLKNRCEIDDKWSPEGRIHTFGFEIVEKENETAIIRQSKLCDIGLLK